MSALSRLNHQLEALLASPDLSNSAALLETFDRFELDETDTAERVDATLPGLFSDITRSMLASLSVLDTQAAYEHALKLRDLPVTDDPFEGKAFSLAVRLAHERADEAGAAFFESRAEQSLKGKASLLALEAFGEALASSYLIDVSPNSPVRSCEMTAPEPPPLPWRLPPAPVSFSPLANTHHEPPTRTYIVLVRKLTDPVTASFAVVSATLADLTDGGPFGREDRYGVLYADLLLEFDEDALPLLDSLDLTGLSLRLVFQASREFETFSVRSKSLYDLEVAREECRLYFKLRVPSPWLASEIPLHLIWGNVESCVLLSETF